MTCPKSPTGAHHFDMSWPEGRYIGTCRYCNDVKEYDANLGMNGKPSTILEGTSYRVDGLPREWVESE